MILTSILPVVSKKAFEEFKFKVKDAPYAHAQLSVQTRARWERWGGRK